MYHAQIDARKNLSILDEYELIEECRTPTNVEPGGYILNGDFCDIVIGSNLIENGDFQEPGYYDDGSTTYFPKWTVETGMTIGDDGNGNIYATFDESSNVITQSFDVDTLGIMEISYDHFVSPFFREVKWRLKFNDEIVASGDGEGGRRWETHTVTYAVTELGEYTLEFYTISGISEARLDNVDVHMEVLTHWQALAGMSIGHEAGNGNPEPSIIFSLQGDSDDDMTNAISQTFSVGVTGTLSIEYDYYKAGGTYLAGWKLIYNEVVIDAQPDSTSSSGTSWAQVEHDVLITQTGEYTLLFHSIGKDGAHEIPTQIDNVMVLVNGQGPPLAEEPPIIDSTVYGAYTSCSVNLGEQHLASTQGWLLDPINSRNGNLSYQVTDLSIPVRGCPLEFQRSYASAAVDVYTSTLGHGWTHNYDMRLHLTDTAISGTVEVQAANGSRLPFYDNGDGSFTPYAGVLAEMQQIGSTYVITGSNQKVYTFDDQGLLQKQEDPYGSAITFTYNTNNQLISAAQGNRSLTYVYDGQDRLTTVTDNSGRNVELGYDTFGDLTIMTNTLELTTDYTYSGTTHLLTEAIDPSGRTIHKTDYDAQGRAYQQWDGEDDLLAQIDYSLPDKRVITLGDVVMTHTYNVRNTLVNVEYACTDGSPGCGTGSNIDYDDNFRQETVQDANGNLVNMVWNNSGANLEQVTDALNNTSGLTYDSYNNLTQVVNALDNTTNYRYDNVDYPTFLTSMTDALEKTTYYTPTTSTDGAEGLLKQVEDPNGNITTYAYNEFGQLIETNNAANTSHAITTTYGYDPVGRLITTTQQSTTENHTSLNVYDDENRLTATIGNWTGSNPANWVTDCDTSPGFRDENVCTQYGYDDAGRTISTTNSLGQASLTFYDGAGRSFLRATNWDGTTPNPSDPFASLCNYTNPDPEKNLCTLTGYDEYGRVITTTNTLGYKSVTEYNSLGRVDLTITHSVDSIYSTAAPDTDIITEYAYDAVGNVTVTTDNLERQTRTFYDALNRIKGNISNWDGSSTLADCANLPPDRETNICTQYQYDSVGNTIIVTNTLTQTTRTFYDDLNRVEGTIANWDGSSDLAVCDQLLPTRTTTDNVCTRYGYDDAGRQITTTNALNQTSLTVYDDANRPYLTVANWDGTLIDEVADCSFPPSKADSNLCSVTYYDDLGRRSNSKDPMGNVIAFAYDDLGRVVTTTRYLDSLPIMQVTTYDALGNRLFETNGRDHTTSFIYDSLNRLVTSTSPEGVVVTTTYNAASWSLSTTNALGHETVNGYDELGRRTTVTDAELNTTTYEYDGLGNQTAMIDAENVRTTYVYDTLNRLHQVIENDVPGNNPTPETDVITTYEYDALGNRTSVTNARDYTSSQTQYDALNRPAIQIDALGNRITTTYNVLGSRVVLTDGNKATTTYEYDGLNRLTDVHYLDDNEDVNYVYDAIGNRKTMTDSVGVTSYLYDDLYRLTSVTDPFTGTVSYGYDLAGNRTQLTYPDSKVVTYTYDMDNRMTQVDDWDAGITTYEYDTIGRLITTTLPNGVATVNVYDDANRLVLLTHTDTADGTLIGEYQYELDKVGNRTTVTETLRQPDNVSNLDMIWVEDTKLLASDGEAGDRFGQDVSIDGDLIIIGADLDDGSGADSGSAYVFVQDSQGIWSQEAKLTADDGAAGDGFGLRVAVNGHTAVVSAISDDDNGSSSGSVYIFVRDSQGNWSQEAKLTADDGAADDKFGFAIGISEDTVVIGANGDDDNGTDSGSVYIFVRDSQGNWGQEAKLTADDGAADDKFGFAIGISEDTAFISANGDDDNGSGSGSVYIFVRDSQGDWGQEAKLTADDGAAGDKFGQRVAINEHTAIIGAISDDDNGKNSGSAYIFVRDSQGNWSQEAKLMADDGVVGDRFGFAVGISGESVIISASEDDDNGSNSGSAYIFMRDNQGNWSQEAKLIADDGAADDKFRRVAISEDTVVIGASGDDDNGTDSGSAYIFQQQSIWEAAANMEATASAASMAVNTFSEPLAETDMTLGSEPLVVTEQQGEDRGRGVPTPPIQTQRVITNGRSLPVNSLYLESEPAPTGLVAEPAGMAAPMMMQLNSSSGVIFTNNASARVGIWSPTEIAAQVPLTATSGDVFVSAIQGSSNSVPFTLGTAAVPDASGQAATWATELAGGTISVDTVWDDDILIKGDITIAANATLTITPGVTVFFAAGADDQSGGSWTNLAEIHVYGTLVAEGTAAAPIYFASNAATPAVGDWGQIALRKDGTLSLNQCMIRHAEKGVYFYASGEGGGVLGGTVQNCVLSDNRSGMQMYGNPGYPAGGTLTLNPTIANNHITNNLDYGVRIEISTGYGNLVGSMTLQNNIIEGSATGIYLRSSTWWVGHSDLYPTIRNNTVRNNTDGIYVWAVGSGDSSGSDTDVQPVIQNNLLHDNGNNIHLLLDPLGSDGTQILNPTIQYNSIFNASNGILIDDNQTYDTLVPTIQYNVFYGYVATGDYAVNNQTSRTMTANDNYWGQTEVEWNGGAQAGDTLGTVTISSFLDAADVPVLSRIAPAQAAAGDVVTLYGANFGHGLETTVIQYEYDPLYRLTDAAYSGAISATYAYVYDAVGNMTAFTETVGITSTIVTRSFNGANQLQTATDTEAGTTSFYCDGNGNLIRMILPTTHDVLGEGGPIPVNDENIFTFNQRNLLVAQDRLESDYGLNIADYTYDGDGNRVQQIAYGESENTTITYTNDNVGLSQVLVADDGMTQTVNLFGLDLIQQDDGSTIRVLLGDALGSARQELVDDVVETTSTYEPFGSLLVQTGISGTTYGFTGEQEDGATELVYLRARYYNSSLKQFQSRDLFSGYDMLPSSQNGHNYVHGNPINYIDPLGLCIEGWIGGSVRMNQYPYGTSGICPNTRGRAGWIIEAHAANYANNQASNPSPRTQILFGGDVNHPIGSSSDFCPQGYSYLQCWELNLPLRLNNYEQIDPAQFAELERAVYEALYNADTLSILSRSIFDTPFHNHTLNPEKDTIVCLGSTCFNRSAVNYFAQGAWSAREGETRGTLHNFYISGWKLLSSMILSNESRKNGGESVWIRPSENLQAWADYGYFSYLEYEKEQLEQQYWQDFCSYESLLNH
ncbi:MAG: hypothetical protein GY943_04170 [Chloroflexi bacterium]|nr:hypothetical protein [Chloroflexota bacterium]